MYSLPLFPPLTEEEREFEGGGAEGKRREEKLGHHFYYDLSFPFIVAEQLYTPCCDVETRDSYWPRAGGDPQV